jgi:hypothetical protein
VGVYGSNDDIVRRVQWDELTELLSGWNHPWCIWGDINITRFPSKRSSDTHSSPIMLDFSEFIFDRGLRDIPLGNFMCSNNMEPILVQD